MTLLVPSRRHFLLGAGALLAAPAIVRAGSLMPVKPVRREFLMPAGGLAPYSGGFNGTFLITEVSEVNLIKTRNGLTFETRFPQAYGAVGETITITGVYSKTDKNEEK